MRRGASWTAAYHRQLTVAAVARPVGSSVAALSVLAVERSWWLLAQTTPARSSLQPVSSGWASSPWSTRPAGTPRHRSPLSSRRCPPIRSRRPGSGCPAVRCPVTWAGRPEGPAVGRLLSTRPVSSRPLSAVHPVRCPAVWCLPSSVRTRPSPPMLRRWRWGPGSSGRATLTTGTGGGPGGGRAVDGSTDGRGAETRATLPKSGWSGGSVAVPGRRVGYGPGRPRLPAERSGRPGPACGAPVAGGCAVGTGGRLQREVAAPAAWRPSSGWGGDHGGWSWPRLTPGWAGPGGPGGCRRGWGCGPSAAQAGGERARLAAGNAVTCGNGWWAWEDLNLRLHPYQQS